MYFSNDDLLLWYYIEIINQPSSSANINLNNYSAFVRVDTGDHYGTTMWAKSLVITIRGYDLILNTMQIVNDVAWILFVTYHNTFFQGAIVKLDGNGNIISAFGILENLDNNKMVSYYFKPSQMIVFSDTNFVLSAETYYYETLGVVEISSQDISIFKFGLDRELKWITSIDFNNKFDANIGIFKFNDTIYGALLNDNQNYCLISISFDTGKLNNSRWFIRENFINGGSISFNLIALTSDYLFWKEILDLK